MYQAISENNMIKLKELLRKGTNPAALNKKKQNTLTFCAELGRDGCLQIILDSGLDANTLDGKGSTAIRYAAKYGH